MSNDFRAKKYDVFVSYKRLNTDAMKIVEKRLEAEGFVVFTDERLQAADDWQQQLRDRINECKVTVGLWSKEVEQEPEEVEFELIHAYGIKRLLGVRLDDSLPPSKLGKDNWLSFSNWNDPDKREEQLVRFVDEVRRMGASPSIKIVQGSDVAPAIDVHLGEIPPAPPKLVGREAELDMLRKAWHERQVNTVVLHALGGAGKSALLRAFVDERLATHGGDGAARIYGWSAYSQGSGTQKRADADGFISQALKDFGYPGELPNDSVERARELAELIQKQRVLLLLDGLEPLQDLPGVNKGKLKDKGLKELIQKLSLSNPGLLVITTRQPIVELENHSGALVTNHPLDRLSPQAGADLLEELGVTGRQQAFEKAVKSVDGHALSVTLLGTFLTQVHGGDIRKQDLFDFHIRLTPEEEARAQMDETLIPAKRAQKVMRGYLEQFEGQPERALLHLLGLFDRPADGGAVEVLLAERIPDLTDDFFVKIEQTKGFFGFGKKIITTELTPMEREIRLSWAKERLRKLRLLASENKDDPNGLDAHPVVRAYFAERLMETAPEAAKIAHDRLYKHYANLGVPETFRNSLGMGVVSMSKMVDPEILNQALHLLAIGALPDEVKTQLPAELTQADPKALQTFLDAMDQDDLKRAQNSLLPDTLEDMQPLFHAIAHGVAAGHVDEAHDEIFVRRIFRGNDRYLERVLGAKGPELAVRALFFEQPWSGLKSDLTSWRRAWNLADVALCLTSLGRLAESVEPRRAALNRFITAENWSESARNGGTLCETLLTLGRVSAALPVAQTALEHAKESDARQQIAIRLTNLANAQLAAGALDESLASFQQAEKLQAEHRPDLEGLVSLRGYQYGDLLLARGETQDALRRGHYQLDIATRYLGQGMGLHNIGLAHLLIGRAQHELNQSEAKASLDAAVDGLRKAGKDDKLPQALLARAAWYRDQAAAGHADMIDKAHNDLNEVEEIAGDEMEFYLVDLALERARLALDAPAAFDDHLATAHKNTHASAALIAQTGYHRRDSDLAELQTRLAKL